MQDVHYKAKEYVICADCLRFGPAGIFSNFVTKLRSSRLTRFIHLSPYKHMCVRMCEILARSCEWCIVFACTDEMQCASRLPQSGFRSSCFMSRSPTRVCYMTCWCSETWLLIWRNLGGWQAGWYERACVVNLEGQISRLFLLRETERSTRHLTKVNY